MSKQKLCVNDAEATVVVPAVVTSSTEVETATFASLSASLAEIRKLKGVIGYILRSNSSAIIDLPPTEKVTEYAMFSSQMVEFSNQVSDEFSLGNAESLIVESGTVKVLCMTLAENKIGVFMEKDAGHAWIIKRILL